MLGTVKTAAFGAVSFSAGGFTFQLLATSAYESHTEQTIHTILVLRKCGNIEYIFSSFSDMQYCQNQWRTQEFCSGGVQQIQLRTEDTEKGDLGDGSPLVRGSGGSCNLVQEISFHIVKFS